MSAPPLPVPAPLRRLSSSQRGTVFALLASIVLLVIGGIYRPSVLAPTSIANLLLLASFIGITAAGQTFVILIGGIDLSIPWVLTAMGIMLTTTSLGRDARAWWVVPLVLVIGLGIGAFNGLGIVLFEIPPVVMTLGMNGIMEGAVLGLTNGFTCPSCNATAPPSVQAVFTGQLIPGIPNGLAPWIIIGVIVSLVLSATTFGRRIYALGNNPVASYLAGVNTRLVTVAVYALSGVFAAIAGMALAAFGTQATLGMGDPFLFQSIAAVVIGGASILGGRGTYWGAMAGAIFLQVVQTVVLEFNVSDATRSIASGVVILLALLLYGREAREV